MTTDIEILVFPIRSVAYLILYKAFNQMCLCFGNCIKLQSTGIQVWFWFYFVGFFHN